MKVRGTKLISKFQANHASSASRLSAWTTTMRGNDYGSLVDLKKHFQQADLVGDRVVFNIGNTYRLIAMIDFSIKIVLVWWIGTHAEYAKIDAKKV